MRLRLRGARSVVLALEHSGSLRYHGGRMTPRSDLLEPAWLDRAIAWFHDRGIAVYLIANEHELPAVRDRRADAPTGLIDVGRQPFRAAAPVSVAFELAGVPR